MTGIKISDVPEYQGSNSLNAKLLGTIDQGGVFTTFTFNNPAADAIALLSAEIESNNNFIVTTSDVLRASAITAGDVEGDEYAFQIIDMLGNIAIGILESGELRLSGLKVESAEKGFVLIVEDENNNACATLNTDGQWWFNLEPSMTLTGQAAAAAVPPVLIQDFKGSFNRGIMMFSTYGQSLSRGSGSSPALSTVQQFGNLTFDNNILNNSDIPRVALTPLVETAVETPCSGTANMLSQLTTQFGVRDFGALLTRGSGLGGRNIVELSKDGTIYDTRFMVDLQAGKTLATAQGDSFNYLFTTWTQGEADYDDGTTEAAYLASLFKLQDDITADVIATTGQSFIPPMFIAQCSNYRNYDRNYPSIALCQLNGAKQRKDIIIACAGYNFEKTGEDDTPGSDLVHLSAEGSRQLGYYYAIAAYKLLILREHFEPLQPIRTVFTATHVDIYFNRANLFLDTTQVALAPNHGFDIYSAAGNVLSRITGVPVITGNKVRLSLSSAVPAGGTLAYAHGIKASTGKDGALTLGSGRGNLRDNQGDDYNYLGRADKPMRLDNWCVCFEVTNN